MLCKENYDNPAWRLRRRGLRHKENVGKLIRNRSSLFISNTVVMTKVFKSMILTRCDLHGRPTAWCLYIQWYWAPAVTGCSVPAVLCLIRPTLSTGHLLVLTLIQSLCSYISQSPCTFTPSIYLCMELIFQPQQNNNSASHQSTSWHWDDTV